MRYIIIILSLLFIFSCKNEIIIKQEVIIQEVEKDTYKISTIIWENPDKISMRILESWYDYDIKLEDICKIKKERYIYAQKWLNKVIEMENNIPDCE